MTTRLDSSWPVDDRLPALMAAHSGGIEAVVARCGIDDHVTQSRVVRYHPGSRCLVDVVAGDRRMALKCFRRDPVENVELLIGIAAAGFADPRGPSITVVAGHSADLACFVSEWFVGPSACELLDQGRGVRLGEIVAAWFDAARSAPAELAPLSLPEDLVTELWHWHRTIVSADAAVGARAATLIDRLSEMLPDHGTPGLLNRSFGVNHIVDLGAGIGLLDWDEPAHGRLELDAGGFMASLAYTATTSPHRVAEAGEASRTFAAHTADTLAIDAMAWAAAAAGVKRAKHVCKLAQPGWRSLADAVLSWAERAAA